MPVISVVINNLGIINLRLPNLTYITFSEIYA